MNGKKPKNMKSRRGRLAGRTDIDIADNDGNRAARRAAKRLAKKGLTK